MKTGVAARLREAEERLDAMVEIVGSATSDGPGQLTAGIEEITHLLLMAGAKLRGSEDGPRGELAPIVRSLKSRAENLNLRLQHTYRLHQGWFARMSSRVGGYTLAGTPGEVEARHSRTIEG